MPIIMPPIGAMVATQASLTAAIAANTAAMAARTTMMGGVHPPLSSDVKWAVANESASHKKMSQPGERWWIGLGATLFVCFLVLIGAYLAR
jgi:hypothetical protein